VLVLTVIRPVAQVLLAVVFLEAALGALSPLIGVQMLRLQAPTELIGIASSAYFVGFLIGTQTCHAIIDRVGHIRAYSALAVVAANATILHFLVPEPWIWIAFRAITGYALAGLFVVVESWLNDKTTVATRGRTPRGARAASVRSPSTCPIRMGGCCSASAPSCSASR
jgi:MFS family permease